MNLPHLDRKITETMQGLAPIEDQEFKEQQQAQALLDIVEEGLSFLRDVERAISAREESFTELIRNLEDAMSQDSELTKEFKEKEALLVTIKERVFITMKHLKQQMHVRKGTRSGDTMLVSEGPLG